MKLSKTFTLKKAPSWAIYKHSIAPCLVDMHKEAQAMAYTISTFASNSARETGEIISVDIIVNDESIVIEFIYTGYMPKIDQTDIDLITKNYGINAILSSEGNTNFFTVLFPTDLFNGGKLSRDNDSDKAILNLFNAYLQQERRKLRNKAIEITPQQNGALIHTDHDISFIVRILPITLEDKNQLELGNYSHVYQFIGHKNKAFMLYQNNFEYGEFIADQANLYKYSHNMAAMFESLYKAIANKYINYEGE